MELKLNIPFKDKNRLMIKMINPIIGNLTSKEIDILVSITDLKVITMTKDSRTDIRMSLNMDKFNFNNYIKKLKTKKILIEVGTDLKVNPKILHMLKHESLNINFV